MNEHPWMNESMSIKRFLEQGGGTFASVQNTNPNDELPIQTVYFDNETYPDNPAIVVNSTKDGEEFKVRLSKANVKRIAEVLSDDEAKWIGNSLRCVLHQDYPGLGKKGLIWTGEKAGQQAGLKPPVNLNAPKGNLVANVLTTETKMWLQASQSDIGNIIDDQAWNLMVQKGIAKELFKYDLIEYKDDYPVLSEKCREYL